MTSAILQHIRSYILSNFLFSDDETLLDNHASFLENGIIDSTGVLELVLFVEDTFEVTVNDQDIVPENFDSATRLAHYIQTKLEASHAVGAPVP